MVQKLAVVVLVGCTLALAACNTVRGAATDVNSAASCTENAMHGGKCWGTSFQRRPQKI